MKKLNKKAFTIVELVIVIAVIAILAAVLIPTFATLVRKSKVSKDTQLIRNLNTALSDDKVTNEHNTMSAALAAADKYGYNVAKINASAKDNEILWDSVNDVFCYLNDGSIEYMPDQDVDKLSVGDYRLWKIFDAAPAADNTYSIYVNSDAAATYLAANDVAVGVDCGDYAVDLISYKNTTGARRDVTFRTTGGNLSVDGYVGASDGDVIKHYGVSDEVEIIKCYTASFHEFGKVKAKVSIAEGRIVVEETGEVPAVEITAADKDIKIETPKDIVVSATATVVASLGAGKLDKVEIKVTKQEAKVVVDEKVDTTKVEVNGQAAPAESLVQITKVGTFAELNDAISAGDSYIMFTDDIAYTTNGSGLLNVTSSMTIDGNGYTLSGYGKRGSQNTTVCINNNNGYQMVDVKLTNLSIANSGAGSRPVETRGNVRSLSLVNCNISATGSGCQQAITIGGNQSTAAKVLIKNSTVSAPVYYGFITFNPVDMTIEGSTFNSWAALYFKSPSSSYGSRGSNIVVNDSTLNCQNNNSGETNDFGAIVFEDGSIDVTVNNTFIDVTQNGTAAQAAVLLSSAWAAKFGTTLRECHVKFVDVTIKGTINNEDVTYDKTNTVIIQSGSTTNDPTAYLADGSTVAANGLVYIVRNLS